DLADALAAVLRRYGELQRDFASEAGAARAIGVADMRPQVMPARFEEALESAGRSVASRGSGSEGDVLRQVAPLRGTYRSRPPRPVGPAWTTTICIPGTCPSPGSPAQKWSASTTGETR